MAAHQRPPPNCARRDARSIPLRSGMDTSAPADGREADETVAPAFRDPSKGWRTPGAGVADSQCMRQSPHGSAALARSGSVDARTSWQQTVQRARAPRLSASQEPASAAERLWDFLPDFGGPSLSSRVASFGRHAMQLKSKEAARSFRSVSVAAVEGRTQKRGAGSENLTPSCSNMASTVQPPISRSVTSVHVSSSAAAAAADSEDRFTGVAARGGNG